MAVLQNRIHYFNRLNGQYEEEAIYGGKVPAMGLL